jgi:uncharacterized protein YdhG (YjbR/CyaY superfamily)
LTVIEEYIHNQPEEHQQVLNEIYQAILSVIPDEATEKISYGMPTFYLYGNLVHFAPAKKHLGLYPSPSAITEFSKELKPYKTSKGAIQFPYTKDLPIALIQEIVQFRVKENIDNQ